MTDAPRDPFGDDPVLVPGAPPQAPAQPQAAAAPPAHTMWDSPFLSVPMNLYDRTTDMLKNFGLNVGDEVEKLIPGAFQRADRAIKDPFGKDGIVTGTANLGRDLGQSAQAADEGVGGGLLAGAPQQPATPHKRREMSLLGEADNLRTGLQRGAAADIAAPISVVDLLHRGLFYGAEAAYNLMPPLRYDVGQFLDRTFNPLAGYNALNKIEPSHHVVNLGGANTGSHGYGSSGSMYDRALGRPNPWDETYTEAQARKDENGAPSLWRSPLHFGDWPESTIAGYHIPGHEGGAPDPGKIVRGVDSAVEGAGNVFNTVSDFMAQQTGRKQGPHVDLSPHEPINHAEQYAQELAAGVPAPGKLLNRLAVAGASARLGMLPGIEGTGYELPARLLATQIAGMPFAYKAGLPSETGQVLRRNVEDLGQYSQAGQKPWWPKWINRGLITPAGPIPGTAERALTGLEGQQKALNALGLSVMPAELAQAGRGDVPKLVGLTNKVAGTEQGQPIRTLLANRPKQFQAGIQQTLDDTVGARPADPATASGNVAAAAQAETQAANAAAEANTQQAFAQVKNEAVPAQPVQALIDRLDEAIDAPSTHPMVAKEIGRFRDMLLDTRNTPAGEPITNIGQLDSALRHFKDRVKLPPDAAEAIPGPAQQPIQEFGDNLQGILNSHPGYAAASAQEAAGDAAAMATTKGRVGAIGNAQQPQNARPVTAAGTARSLMLNPENSSPAAIAEAAQALNRQDPGAWRGIVSEWLNRELAKAYGGGTDPEMGARMASRVFGDPDKKAILKTALEHVIGPDGQPLGAAGVEKVLSAFGGLENTDALSRAAARGAPDVTVKKPPGMIGAFFSGLAHSVPGVRDIATAASFNSASRLNTNLGTVLGSPTGISQILDLAYRGPRVARGKAATAMLLNDTRNVGRSLMFGNGGGLPLASPLMDPEVSGGGGDQPKPPGPLRVEIRPRP